MAVRPEPLEILAPNQFSAEKYLRESRLVCAHRSHIVYGSCEVRL